MMRILWNLIGVLAVVGVLGVTFFFTTGARAASSLSESEPNDSCAAAQVLGALDAPLTVTGALDGPSSSAYPAYAPPPGPGGSVDFFRISAAPASLLQLSINLSNRPSSTLSSTIIGAFTSGCGFLAASDNLAIGDFTGGVSDSQLQIRVPSDGVLVIAVSGCCDASFTQPGFNGTYTLTIDTLKQIGSISGRLVDAATHAPIGYGDNRPIEVELVRCPANETINCIQSTPLTIGPDGRFRIAAQDSPLPLDATDYYLNINGNGQSYPFLNSNLLAYPSQRSASFAVAAGEDKDIGDVALSRPQPVGTISGRVLDSQTGKPLAGAELRLRTCDFCSKAFIASGADGTFSISAATIGVPILEGNYTLSASAPGYEVLNPLSFSLTAGQSTSLGDIALTPAERIGSISARLIDAVTKQPLAANGIGTIILQRCDQFGCFETVGFTAIEAGGRISFTPPNPSDISWRPGSFAISYFLDQHLTGQTAPFSVGKDQHLDIGDIAVQPIPITLVSGPDCGTIPAGGGTCNYSLTVTNNQAQPAALRAWSVVSAFSLSSQSSFQPQGDQRLRLRSLQSSTLNFAFDVPRKVQAFTFICTTFYVADDAKGFYFAATSQTFGFCVTKDASGGFRPVHGDELRQLQQRLSHAPAGQRGVR